MAWIKEYYPHLTSLRDVTMKMLNQYVASKDKVIYQRCKYVVEENERLLKGCEYLQQGNLPALGEKMFQSHIGLSKDYEVSCEELDFLVNAVKDNPAVLGARMMGGGFGGCTINLVKENSISNLLDQLKPGYKKAFSTDIEFYVVSIENGTEGIGQ